MTVLEYVLAFALNFISNYIFVCRTVFVIIIIVLCFSILVKCRKISFDQLVGRRIIVALPFLISLVSIILVDLYDEDIAFFRQLNFILNYRLSFSQNALFDRGISLFGNNYLLLGNSLSTSGKLSVWSDLSFLRYLLKYGIIAYVILIIYLTYFAYLIYEKRDLYLYVVFMFTLLFTTFNSDFFCMNYNYLLFVLSYKSFKV